MTDNASQNMTATKIAVTSFISGALPLFLLGVFCLLIFLAISLFTQTDILVASNPYLKIALVGGACFGLGALRWGWVGLRIWFAVKRPSN
jgi:hypothetical protein